MIPESPWPMGQDYRAVVSIKTIFAKKPNFFRGVAKRQQLRKQAASADPLRRGVSRREARVLARRICSRR